MLSKHISVIVISRNEGDYLRSTVNQLLDTVPAGSDIVVIDDGSVDRSSDFLASYSGVKLVAGNDLGVARARNVGARQTSGDVLIFADAHLRFEPHWWEPLAEIASKPGAGAAAPAISAIGQSELKGFGLTLTGPDLDAEWLPRKQTQPYTVPILPGACLAMTRTVFEATGGFDEGLISRGGVDNELGVRLWLLGYELYVVPHVEVQHLFRNQPPYQVASAAVLHNRLRLAFSHFRRKRIRVVIDALRDQEAFPSALAQVIDGDIFLKRERLRNRRLHDDDWFFNYFGLEG